MLRGTSASPCGCSCRHPQCVQQNAALRVAVVALFRCLYDTSPFISPPLSVSRMETCSNVLEEFFPGENLGGGDDASSEWLSIFVEDCLSSSTSYTTSHPFPAPTTTTHPDPQSPTLSLKPPETQKPKPLARGRPKRRKTNSRAHPYEQPHSFHADPPLLHQAHWLAESELVFPKKEQEEKAPSVQVGGEDGEEGKVEKDGQQPRRCTHCLSHRTPQWRAGPLGPKTLCNACGVRFKSGRLLPEYRPAKSPTFVSYKHSNSHKKVLEMRMALLSSHSN